MAVDRDDWQEQIRDVIRSRHYTWLPEGLGGETPEVAMTWLVTDIMHLCHRSGIDWEKVVQTAQEQFHREELESQQREGQSTSEH